MTNDQAALPNTSNHVRFSVIIPSYNRADLVMRAVDSVLTQDYQSFEIVFVDDGSDDDTREKVTRIPDSRLRYIRIDRSGAARARNRGALESQGDFLIFLDSDDEGLPGWLTTMAEASSQRVELISCASLSVKPSGMTKRSRPMEVGFTGSGLRAHLLSGTFAMKRTLFLEIGGYNEQLPAAQHTDLSLRLLRRQTEVGLEAVYVDAPLVRHYRNAPHSIRDDDRAVLEATEFVLTRHADLLARSPIRLADYHGLAGMRAIRLGEMRKARLHMRASVRSEPRSLRRWLRLIAASLPGSRALWLRKRSR